MLRLLSRQNIARSGWAVVKQQVRRTSVARALWRYNPVDNGPKVTIHHLFERKTPSALEVVWFLRQAREFTPDEIFDAIDVCEAHGIDLGTEGIELFLDAIIASGARTRANAVPLVLNVLERQYERDPKKISPALVSRVSYIQLLVKNAEGVRELYHFVKDKLKRVPDRLHYSQLIIIGCNNDDFESVRHFWREAVEQEGIMVQATAVARMIQMYNRNNAPQEAVRLWKESILPFRQKMGYVAAESLVASFFQMNDLVGLIDFSYESFMNGFRQVPMIGSLVRIWCLHQANVKTSKWALTAVKDHVDLHATTIQDCLDTCLRTRRIAQAAVVVQQGIEWEAFAFTSESMKQFFFEAARENVYEYRKAIVLSMIQLRFRVQTKEDHELVDHLESYLDVMLLPRSTTNYFDVLREIQLGNRPQVPEGLPQSPPKARELLHTIVRPKRKIVRPAMYRTTSGLNDFGQNDLPLGQKISDEDVIVELTRPLRSAQTNLNAFHCLAAIHSLLDSVGVDAAHKLFWEAVPLQHRATPTVATPLMESLNQIGRHKEASDIAELVFQSGGHQSESNTAFMNQLIICWGHSKGIQGGFEAAEQFQYDPNLQPTVQTFFNLFEQVAANPKHLHIADGLWRNFQDQLKSGRAIDFARASGSYLRLLLSNGKTSEAFEALMQLRLVLASQRKLRNAWARYDIIDPIVNLIIIPKSVDSHAITRSASLLRRARANPSVPLVDSDANELLEYIQSCVDVDVLTVPIPPQVEEVQEAEL